MTGGMILILLLLTKQVHPTEIFIDDLWLIDLQSEITNINKDIKMIETDNIENLKNDFIKISKMYIDIKEINDNYGMVKKELIEDIINNKERLQNSINIIKNNIESQKINKMSQECIQDIKNQNYTSAINKIYLINDENKINDIIYEVYNNNKTNFKNILKFGDEIPLISISLIVYKSLLNVSKINNQYDEYLGLDLIQSIKIQINDQIGVDLPTRNEASDILELLKKPVKSWMVQKFGIAVLNLTSEVELNRIIEKINYESYDYKFFREISDQVVLNYYPNNTKIFFDNLFELTEQNGHGVTHVILYQSLFNFIYNKGVSSDTVMDLLILHNAMKIAYENERKGFKTIAYELFKNTQNIPIILIKKFVSAILNDYYLQPSITSLNQKLLEYVPNIYENVTISVINQVYGKKNTIDLITLFRRCRDLKEYVTGFAAIYDKMKQSGETELKPQNVGALIKMEEVVRETLAMPNMKNLDISYDLKLKNIYNQVLNSKLDVAKILVYSLFSNNYTSPDHQIISYQIFDAELFGYYAALLAKFRLNNLNTEKLIDYALSLPRIEERLVQLNAIQMITPNTSLFMFDVAESYKRITELPEYDSIGSIFKSQHQKKIRQIPFSIRNIVYTKQVYIKNTIEGGEYLFSSDIVKNNKRDVFTRLNWRRGNNTIWVIERTTETGVYTIKNSKYNEYLCASDEFDIKNRYVFLTKNTTEGNKWRFIPLENGLYIKNLFYKEYLYAGFIENKENRFVFTWRTGVETAKGKWTVEDATTDY